MDSPIIEVRRRDMSGSNCPLCWDARLEVREQYPPRKDGEEVVVCVKGCGAIFPRYITKAELVRYIDDTTECESEGQKPTESCM